MNNEKLIKLPKQVEEMKSHLDNNVRAIQHNSNDTFKVKTIYNDYEYITQQSPLPLNISDFSGYNEPYHPSLLYFDNKWNGYKFWMAFTPFPADAPPYVDRWECPCIAGSNDGVNWTTLVNPMDDLTASEIANYDYFSDPNIFMVGGVMECWYRLTRGNNENTLIIRRTSIDGVNWSERQIINDGNVFDIISQGCIFKDGKYELFYCHKDIAKPIGVGQYSLRKKISKDLKTWTTEEVCILDNTLLGFESQPWHMDIHYVNNKYYMLSFARPYYDLTIYESSDGLNFKATKKNAINPISNQYPDGCHKSALLFTGNKAMLYFMGADMRSGVRKHRIGLAVGDSIYNLQYTSNTLNVGNGKPYLGNGLEAIFPVTKGINVFMNDETTVEDTVKSIYDTIYRLSARLVNEGLIAYNDAKTGSVTNEISGSSIIIGEKGASPCDKISNSFVLNKSGVTNYQYVRIQNGSGIKAIQLNFSVGSYFYDSGNRYILDLGLSENRGSIVYNDGLCVITGGNVVKIADYTFGNIVNLLLNFNGEIYINGILKYTIPQINDNISMCYFMNKQGDRPTYGAINSIKVYNRYLNKDEANLNYQFDNKTNRVSIV